MKAVAIYCASKMPQDLIYINESKKLAKQLAENNIKIIYGGANNGLMKVIADEALKHGGEVVGVLPENVIKDEVRHPHLTEFHSVNSMHERKALIETLAEGFIALPGGYGTMDEIFEIITWKAIGLHKKPTIFFNIDHYYDDLQKFVNKSDSMGLLDAKDAVFTSNVEEIIDILITDLSE